MNRKGFTLIELLAVIVILAIIALIATPIVLNIINNTKNSATLRSAEYYANAVDYSIVNRQMNNQKIEDGTYNILSNGNICLVYEDSMCIDELVVSVSGDKPTSGKITIGNGKISAVYKLTISDKKVSTNSKNELEIKEYQIYKITYENITETTNLIKEIEEGETLAIDLAGKNITAEEITVKVNGEEINDYTYTNYILTVPNVSGNVVVVGVEGIPAPVSFEVDDWSTIIANVKAGKTDKYIVGAEKTITLTSDDTNVAGTYTVRLANKTTNDSVCSTENYSQTACGFVIEFVDIITTHNMNPAGEYNGADYDSGWSVDGWPASAMRKFVTPVDGVDGSGTIYNALPEEVRTAIIDTRVVSGYEINKTENYTSTDKLYLLSTKEIYGTAEEYDKVKEETRQLDYYLNAGLTRSSSDRSVAIKYLNGTAKQWWLRSADFDDGCDFYYVFTSGYCYNHTASNTYGVAPAFRLG